MDDLNILIASGSRAKHKIIGGQLKHLPHKEVYVRTGDEVLRQAQITPFHVIIIQAQLPMVSGLEVCRRLSGFEGTKDIPVVIFSSDEALRTRALSAGARAFIKVPFCNIQLITVIRKLLAKMKTILHVEHDTLMHDYVRQALSQEPYDVISTRNPLEIKTLIENKRPDVILMNLKMPGASGDELCSDLKSNEAFCGIPVIMCSSDGGDAALNVSFRSGADDYLVKPFSKPALISKLEKACRRRRRRNQEVILVVEDAQVVRNLIIQGLNHAGFMVVSATNGQEALDILNSSQIDLVLTDLEMPVMNGRELTRQIRKSDKHTHKPVLMLSADQDEVSGSREKSIGVDEYIRKPFLMDQLVILIEKMLSEHRLRQEQAAIKRYLSDAALERAKENLLEGTGTMRADSRFMTIFFVDIVGFTPMCEQMGAREVVTLLNDYFDTAVEVLRNNDAMIDKFIGDAIMALFGRVENGAYRAVQAGLTLIDAVKELNEKTGRSIKIRVGINSGNVIMGDIGSKLYRRDYTAIGDAVNVAQRLEQGAQENSVIIGEVTRSLLQDVIEVETLDTVKVKGRQEGVLCHNVVSLQKVDID